MSDAPITSSTAKDRPALNPGGCECHQCGCVFVGEEWHQFCGVCIDVIAAKIVGEQASSSVAHREWLQDLGRSTEALLRVAGYQADAERLRGLRAVVRAEWEEKSDR